jgi:hypothetical protein
MKLPSLFIFIPICIAFVVIVWSLIWHYSPWKRRRIGYKRDYNMKYNRISCLVDTAVIDHKNYVWISSLLHHLGQCPYKNREKTQVLSMRFWDRFKDVREKEVEQELGNINKN